MGSVWCCTSTTPLRIKGDDVIISFLIIPEGVGALMRATPSPGTFLGWRVELGLGLVGFGWAVPLGGGDGAEWFGAKRPGTAEGVSVWVDGLEGSSCEPFLCIHGGRAQVVLHRVHDYTLRRMPPRHVVRAKAGPSNPGRAVGPGPAQAWAGQRGRVARNLGWERAGPGGVGPCGRG